jgi:Gpi18-like mannosyltransferase
LRGDEEMEKFDLKKYVFRISLILILLISVCLCVYSVKNYKSNNTITQNNQFQREGKESNRDLNNMLNNQTPPENKSSSDKKVKSSENGSMPLQHGNMFTPNGDMKRENTNTKYISALTAYSLVFLILCIGCYCLFKRKNIKIKFDDEKILIVTLLAVGFFLRIASSTLMDGHNDINLFKNWASNAANGLSQFYSSAKSADYPPLYIYFLALIGKLASISTLNSYFVLMLKIPSIIADIVTSYFIYRIGKKHLSSKMSILLATFYIFNPAIFIDSTFWGQVDSIFTLLIVIAIFLLSENKIAVSSAIFATAILMKPQGIIFLPILFFELIRQKTIKNFINAAISAIITALIIIIPFSLNQQSPLWIINLYTKTISEYPYASVNAFNFFGLIGGNFKDYNNELFIINYHTMGMIFIVVTTLIGWFVYIKGNNRKYVSAIALLQIAGVFTFSVGMHERYLFPAVALAVLAFIYLNDRRFLILAIGFSITSYINISLVLFSLNSATFNILLMITSSFNVVLVIYLVKILFKSAIKKG